MKNLYFVQANVLYGNSIYLPYAAGAIASYAFQNKAIKDNYDLKKIIYLRENIDNAIDSMKSPDVVGFSNYIWNHEYNKEFAKKLKCRYPDCIIIFGGHNVPSKSSELLETEKYIDYLIHDEGEVPFEKLLLYILFGGEISEISNLSYRDSDGTIKRNESKIYDVCDFPSPYQTGVFDEIIKETPYILNGMLETNRGCPFGCAFCDWGIYKSKVRSFPEERIKKDIEWFVDNKIEFLTCADANFGILERDLKICDWLIESKEKYGYPSKIQFCFTKGRDDLVFELNKKLNEFGMSKGATLSLQTLAPEALKNIGRRNPTFEKFCEIIKKYNELDIPTYTEIILGLPGETYESFCEGLNKLLKAGQHNSIIVFNCEVLLNSRLGQKEIQDELQIGTVSSPYKQHHCIPLDDEVTEYSHILASSYSMTKDDWVNCNLFVAALGGFHNLGLLQCFAVYCYFEYGLDYSEFYNNFLDWIFNHKDTEIYGVFSDIKEKLQNIAYNSGDWKYVIDECGEITWPYEEGAFLKTIIHKDNFYYEIKPFLLLLNIPDEIFDDLFIFQKYSIKYPLMTDFSFEISYDFQKYFVNALVNNPVKLEKKNVKISLNNAEIPDNWEDYARELVWYGKRGNKTNNIRNFVTEVLDI